MLNLLSILIGLVAFVIALAGLIPLVGIVNWIALPIAAVGAVVGVLSRQKTGRNLNLIVLAIAIGRLMLGGGLL